jgi:hypothetical protein
MLQRWKIGRDGEGSGGWIDGGYLADLYDDIFSMISTSKDDIL